MLRVTAVEGPGSVTAGEEARWRVTAFTEPTPAPADAARVSWLVKSLSGAALAHAPHVGPDWSIVVPDHWAGETATVMPYLNAPSASIAVRTSVSSRPGAPPPLQARHVEISTQGGRYYASVDGEPRFFLGADVRYGSRRGLMNTANPPGPRYRPEDYDAAHGDWAWYLLPTITCESKGHFTCLNTYDRAAFTFGHMQLAAHTPDDNFVVFLRELLAHPSAAEYFPELAVHGARVCCHTNGAWSPIESAADTALLMRFFNATPDTVDPVEAERAARMIDWTTRHRAARDLQVAFSVREQRKKLARHATKLPLDGLTDKLCLVVLDILHQGRAGYVAIRAALAQDDPFDALLNLGSSAYAGRVATLRAAIRDLEGTGRVGTRVYDRASGQFVVPQGA